MLPDFTVRPVGRVRSPVRDAMIDDRWGGVHARIELDPERFGPDCVAGLGEFSHIEVVFLLDKVAEGEVETGARHPRNRPDWPAVGIFAQRARRRPNRIGVTVCRLLAVEGLAVVVDGLDAIEGTPVLDLKPYIREFGPKGSVRQPDWATELMSGYWSANPE